MSTSNKIIMSSFLVLVATTLLAMEKKFDKSEPLNIVNKSASEQSYASYISLTNISTGFNHLSDCVASSLGSLSNTITNQISDEAAFKKLGWPLSDEIAQQELKRSEGIYKRHNELFKKYEAYPEYLEDCNAINRRTQYCQRVLFALYTDTIVNHADRAKLALHCLIYHKQVLNDFDKSKFLFFIQKDQKKTKLDIKTVDQGFEHLTIVPNDNDLLNDLLNQTIKQKEEEQKVKLAKEQELQKKMELQKQKEIEKQKEIDKKNNKK